MALTKPTNYDDTDVYVYNWKNMSESSDSVDGSNVSFDFEADTVATLINLTGIDTTPSADIYQENTSTGKHKYYKYDTGWVLTTGDLVGLDARVYFRKNGVDYPVDGSEVTVDTVSNYINVTFSNPPSTTVADAVVLSYAYQDATNPAPAEYCSQDFNPKYNGNDFDTITCLGGKTFKTRKPPELTEVDLTVKKTTNSLSSFMLGERIITTINGKTVRSTTGGNDLLPKVIKIETADPDDSTKILLAIYRNLGATSYDFSGSTDNPLEEKITLKCEPDQSIELEIDA